MSRFVCQWAATIKLIALAVFATGCTSTMLQKDSLASKPAANVPSGTAAASKHAPISSLPALSRDDFNRLAASCEMPLFWSSDQKNPGVLDPDELTLLGVGTDRRPYIEQDKLTPLFARAYRTLVEGRRREALRRELDQGRVALVHTDFSNGSPADRELVLHVTRAARIIEELFALQLGSFGLRNCMPPGDMASRALFRRNQRPWCQAPATQKDPFCNACPDFAKQFSGLYPPDLAADPELCNKLANASNAAVLLDPFTVVRRSKTGLMSVPYSKEWPARMHEIAAELRAAAAAFPAGEEQAFINYLLAAAASFENNNWQPADEAWAAMNSTNSRWYLRIGPDEVYEDPCNRKAMFQVSFAKIDPDSIYWQERLAPLRSDMEKTLADLIGPSYCPRQVSFHLPDFIEIILNAGDAREPLGAVVGQSLPNWGKVAIEGRGRTVVMSNLYSDPDSRTIDRARGDSLLSSESMRAYSDDKRLGLLDTILHEATHNLGPHSDYKINGKRPGDIFGGPMASILEELKAQTGALFFTGLLVKKGILSDADAGKVYNHSIRWAFGHVARGMTDEAGRPKPYSQLAAVQLAELMRAGALVWRADSTAANGRDRGCFVIDYQKIPAVIEKLMQRVGTIKAKGDVSGAKELVDSGVKKTGLELIHSADIAERVRRYPKASFTYSITN